jgi:hypothetical protein
MLRTTCFVNAFAAAGFAAMRESFRSNASWESVDGAVSRWLIIVAQQRKHLVQIHFLLARRLRFRASCDLAQDPFASFQSRIAAMLLLLMRLLEKQDPNSDSAGYNHRTHNVGQEVGKSIPNGSGMEEIWVA